MEINLPNTSNDIFNYGFDKNLNKITVPVETGISTSSEQNAIYESLSQAGMNSQSSQEGNFSSGFKALYNLTPQSGGLNNTAIGYQAGFLTTLGQNNFFGGYQSGYSNVSGVDNVFLGNQSGFSNVSGGNNTFLGHLSGYSHISGNNNFYGGILSGYYAITSSGGVFLGNSAGYWETDSNKLFIDSAARASEADGRLKALIYGEFAATVAGQTVRLNASNIGLGGVDYVWPSSQGGVSTVLKNDGSGNLSWNKYAYPEVDIPFKVGATQLSSGMTIVSDLTGDVLFFLQGLSTSADLTIYRYARDVSSGQYLLTNSTVLTVVQGDLAGGVVCGNYLYILWASATPTLQIRRYDKADLGNVTTITHTNFGGATEAKWLNLQDARTGVLTNYVDAIYVSYDYATYSGTGAPNYDHAFLYGFIQGTDIVFSSSGFTPITMGDIRNASVFNTSTKVYSTVTVTGNLQIKKYNFVTGSNQTAESTTSVNVLASAYPNNSSVQLFNQAGMMGMGIGHTIESNSAIISSAVKLLATTLP